MGPKASKEESPSGDLNVSGSVLAGVDDVLTRIDLLKSVQNCAEELQKNLDSDIRQLKVNQKSFKIITHIWELYKVKELRKKVGDQLADSNAGKVLTEYIKMMTSCGTKTPETEFGMVCLTRVMELCWNYSDRSSEFRLNLGKNDLFSFLIANLNALYDRRQEKDVNEIICGCLAILHNCVREIKNRKCFEHKEAIKVILPYKKTESQLTTVLSTLILAYLIKEKDSDLTATNDSVIKSILEYLKFAIASPDHRYDGFSAEELVDGLRHLANNDSNKKKIVEGGVLTILAELMDKGSASEKEECSKLAWVLSFNDENKSKILQKKNLMTSLKILSKTSGQTSASGALLVLSQSAPASKTDEKFSNKEGNDEVISGKHIMISYERNYKDSAMKIKHLLEKENYEVWIDVDDGMGFDVKTMKKAVGNSEVFLYCVSETYKDSVNCRTETLYANMLRKCLVPVKVEQDYHPDGWLGDLVGSNVCYDLSNDGLFRSNFPKLLEELGNKKYKTETVANPNTHS